MRKVVILRGIPGSGKSTVAGLIEAFTGVAPSIVSADHYFTDADGVYRFNPSLLGEAHGACLRRFLDLLTVKAVPLVVVDNTNTSVEEVAPYYAAAEAYGYEVCIVTVECNPYEAVTRNTHGVSIETTIRMESQQLRSLPMRWSNIRWRSARNEFPHELTQFIQATEAR